MKAADFRAIVASSMSEEELDRNVVDTCKPLGLWNFHPYDSRKSAAGWPDRVFIGAWVMFRELKTATGRLTRAQRDVIARLERAGADVGVYRPCDWFSGRIVAELTACARGQRAVGNREGNE